MSDPEGDHEQALDTAVAALRDSLVVTGCGPTGESAAAQVATDDPVVTREPSPAARAAFIGVDLAAPTPALEIGRELAAAGTFVVCVAAVPPRPDADGRRTLAELRAAVDAVVLVGGTDPVADTAAGLATLIRLVAGADEVNLDLADVETTVGAGGFAAVGTAQAADPEEAVAAALDACGPVSLERATGALVHLTGGRELSVQAAGDAVAAVRDQLVDGSHVIWGAGATEADTDAETEKPVTAWVVLAGVIPVRPPVSAGDPCPRCGEQLVGYRLSDRETVACDGCRFADVTAPLGGEPLVPGEDYGSGS
ncbi:hypothetical protein [Halosegnis sp.]|uniref:hypothetical protein n=1 Tax=Halosegnis sp. TaxID=2864959 RepID=UPI0035D3E4F8